VYDLRFHCSRVQNNESDQVFFTPTKKFSHKCVARTKLPPLSATPPITHTISNANSKWVTLNAATCIRPTRNAETPVKHQRSLSASDAIKKVILPERQLNLPELASNESLTVQTETVRLNGQNTINSVEKLLAMTTNLTAEVTQLKTDNAVLKVHISELQDLLSAQLCHMEAAVGTISSQPGIISYKDALAINQYQEARNVNISKRI